MMLDHSVYGAPGAIGPARPKQSATPRETWRVGAVKDATMRVHILEINRALQPGHVVVHVRDPLPSVPKDMMIAIDPRPDERAIWMPLAKDHPFGEATGLTGGYPGELVDIANRLAADEIDTGAAEAELADVLTRWSQATNPDS